MKTAKEWFSDGMTRLSTFSVEGLLPSLVHCSDGAIQDVKNINGCCYYQWSACLADVMRPRQVVELGGAMGVWSLCILHYLPQESHLYSITLPENGIEFSFIKDQYPNLTMILGNDLDLDNFHGVGLVSTDLWFIDSEHTPEHLTKELDLYSPFFKKGALVLLDDIRSFGLFPVWERFRQGEWGEVDCYEATDPLHYSGYGLAVKL